jgi:spore germination cell wall hydrolase CwlJ-like protein
MKMTTIIGGIASSAVIVAMAGIYWTATRAEAAVNPSIDFSRVVYLPAPDLPTLNDVISDSERECLVHNIYFEARGESLLGQRAVAWVTLNRMFSEQFPNSICDVVWQDSQFSWTHDGKSDTPRDADALALAEEMAAAVLESYHTRLDPTDGATYFHSSSVRPAWRRSFERVVQIDQHIFYKDG